MLFQIAQSLSCLQNLLTELLEGYPSIRTSYKLQIHAKDSTGILMCSILAPVQPCCLAHLLEQNLIQEGRLSSRQHGAGIF